jgi:hypothetical protein
MVTMNWLRLRRVAGHRVLIFSTMTMLLDSVEEVLEWAGLEFLRLDGTTKGTERGQLIEEFRKGKVRLPTPSTGAPGHCSRSLSAVLHNDWHSQVSHRVGTSHAVEHSFRRGALLSCTQWLSTLSAMDTELN